MIRRWLIGCLCLLPLVLCGLGWVWSESHGAALSYVYHDTHRVQCGTSFGRVRLRWERAKGFHTMLNGPSIWSWRPDPAADALYPDDRAWLGFRIRHREDASTEYRRVAVPYWFLLILSALLLLLAWRTTRPRQGGGQGFPVELATRKEPA